MATLYLVEQGAVLKKSSRRLKVEKEREVLLEIPEFKIERVLIFGNVQVSTQALGFLLENGIELSFLTINGRLKGQLVPPKSKNVVLRMAHYEKARDKEFCLSLSRCLVANKIKNSLEVIRKHNYNHPEVDFGEEKEELKSLLRSLERKTEVRTILGVEGISAVNYFRALSKMFRKELAFGGRNRRPPRDPVNSLLSLGYVLVGNELQSILQSVGFDPYIGFLHGIDYGRPSLALDLLEEFRPTLVDRFVLNLANNRVFSNKDFEEGEDGGSYLKPEPRKRYFRQYEEWMNSPIKDHLSGENTTFRKLFLNQAHRLANQITKNQDYKPYTLCS